MSDIEKVVMRTRTIEKLCVLNIMQRGKGYISSSIAVKSGYRMM